MEHPLLRGIIRRQCFWIFILLASAEKTVGCFTQYPFQVVLAEGGNVALAGLGVGAEIDH